MIKNGIYLKGWLKSLCAALLWFYASFFCFRQNQVVLLETLEQEISKFKECNSILDINALVSIINAFLNLYSCRFSCWSISSNLHIFLVLNGLQEDNQPVQIFGTNCCWRGCGTSVFPLNRKGTGKEEQAQSASGSKSSCSKPVGEGKVCHFSVGLRLPHEFCAPPQTSRKGAQNTDIQCIKW